MDKHQYFITGIGTGVGKTFVSAILAYKLNAAYWKPIQAGTYTGTDTDFVRRLTCLPDAHFIPPVHVLDMPASPHIAAKIEQKQISLLDFASFDTHQYPRLIVEGAGGILVPINDYQTMLDLIRFLGLPVIIVSQHYLGSINHTLLTIRILQQSEIPIKGIIFNGYNPETERIILKMSNPEYYLGTIPTVKELDVDLSTLISKINL
ncbi:MAG: dethiobiotin synthase [Bacteroidia bacterium]|nr:dethiobiotin synthase [Bacteroidia bacterium]MDW8346742.1 dethiobiotin synthase [Bacteroidia bacterium]